MQQNLDLMLTEGNQIAQKIGLMAKDGKIDEMDVTLHSSVCIVALVAR